MAYEDIQMEPESDLTSQLMMESTGTVVNEDEGEMDLVTDQPNYSEENRVGDAIDGKIKVKSRPQPCQNRDATNLI